MSANELILLAIAAILVICALVWRWVSRAPELHPDDRSGFSDAERSEIDTIHEEDR